MKKLLLLSTALVAAADPAQADPVTAAAAWIGGVLASGGIAAFAMNMALSVGLSAISGALFKPKGPEVSVSFDVKMGDALPLSFVVGDYATAGKRKYLESWGRNTRFITEVIEVSALPQGLAAVWVDDEPVAFVANRRGYVSGSPGSVSSISEGATVPGGSLDVGQPITNHADDGNRIWIKFLPGTQAAADPFLVWAFGAHADYPWTAAMVGRGKSYAIVTTRYDSDTLSSYPAFLFQPAPLPLYDLRFDSTNGGSGAQRWTDRTTWQPTRNPAVIAYNIARGMYFGGEWVFGGKNLPAWRLPPAEWIAAANACDAPQALAGGGTEPRYRCGMEIAVDMEPASVLEEIGKSANMKFAEVGGRLKPIVDLPGTAVLSFTDGDILVTEGQSFDPFYPVAETFNTISSTYPERAEKWAAKDAPLYIDADATTADEGRYLPVAMTYPAVPFAGQVQRLQRSAIRDYRRMRRHQFYLPPDAYALEPGIDLVAYSSERNGYINKQFMVERVAKAPGMNVLVSLREVDPSDYDWSSDFEQPVIITPPINPVPFIQPINGLTVTGAEIRDEASNARRPAILVACEGDEVGVTHIQIEARVLGRSEVTDTLRQFSAPFAWYLLNVLPNTPYQVRARLLSERTPRSVWSSWISVTTPDVRLGGGDIGAGVLDTIHLGDSLIEFIELNAGTSSDDVAALLAARDAAIAARDLAQTAAGLADQAFDDAEAARIAAEAAEDIAVGKALEAVNSAGAAAGSATAANASADLAGTRATAASASVTAAQTAAGQAQASQTAAASSATTAEGAAVSAAQSSTVSVNAVMRVLPADLSEGAKFWTTAAGGSPATIASPATGTNITVNADGTITFPATAAATTNFLTKGVLPYRQNRTYRITAEVRARGAVPPANRLRAAVRRLGADYGSLTFAGSGDLTPTAVDTWQVRTGTVESGTHATAVWLRAGIQDGAVGTPAADIDVRSVVIEDITDSLAAAGSAAAAAGSEQVASTKATEAGQSASAAQASATSASTSAGNAASSRDTAASHATTAVDAAGAAANSATAAASSVVQARSAAAVALPAKIAAEFWSGLGSAGLSVDSNSVLTIAASGVGSPFVLPVGSLPYIEGHSYKITVRIRSTGGVNGANRIRGYARIADEAGAFITSADIGNLSPSAGGQWQQTFGTWKAPALAGAATIQIGLSIDGAVTPARATTVSWIRFEDVTESIEAGASATAAAGSASTASTSATTAGQHATAAQSSATDAATERAAAGVHRIAAATAATDAAASSASAYVSEQTSARLMSGGISPNPTFRNWNGANTTPTGYRTNITTNTWVQRVTDPLYVKYPQAAQVKNNGNLTYSGPTLELWASDYAYANNNPDAVYVTCELSRTEGSGNGAHILAFWSGSNNRSVIYSLEDVTPHQKATTVTFVAERPAGFNPGANPDFRIALYATSTGHGNGAAPNAFFVHRLDYHEVTLTAAVTEWQRAKTSVERIASAAYGLRVKAGSAGAEFEIVALDNPATGPVSAARISADLILLDGTVDIKAIKDGAVTNFGVGGSTLLTPNNNDYLLSYTVVSVGQYNVRALLSYEARLVDLPTEFNATARLNVWINGTLAAQTNLSQLGQRYFNSTVGRQNIAPLANGTVEVALRITNANGRAIDFTNLTLATWRR